VYNIQKKNEKEEEGVCREREKGAGGKQGKVHK
jgi:hypothetical protein